MKSCVSGLTLPHSLAEIEQKLSLLRNEETGKVCMKLNMNQTGCESTHPLYIKNQRVETVIGISYAGKVANREGDTIKDGRFRIDKSIL